MNPGGVIEVCGVDFEFEEAISFALIGPEVEIPLGEITADTEGAFLQIIALPVDLKEGTYRFRAVTDDHETLSPALLVQGPAILNEGGGQGLRDDDDGLLAPMPTFAPGVVTATAIPITVTSDTSGNSRIEPSVTAITIIILVLGAAILFIRKLRTS